MKRHFDEATRLKKSLHGKLLYADRLCKNGDLAKAKEYCDKHGLPFPPFNDKLHKNTPNHAEAPPPPVTEEDSSGKSHAAQREADEGFSVQTEECSGAGAECSPIETALPEVPPAPPAPAPNTRKCRVTHFCPNPKLMGIRFTDNGENAAAWITRVGFKINDTLTVELERGTPGINAIYAEVKRPV
jgi:hypothetical protein